MMTTLAPTRLPPPRRAIVRRHGGGRGLGGDGAGGGGRSGGGRTAPGTTGMMKMDGWWRRSAAMAGATKCGGGVGWTMPPTDGGVPSRGSMRRVGGDGGVDSDVESRGGDEVRPVTARMRPPTVAAAPRTTSWKLPSRSEVR
ncbi:hypothetical protein H257_15114 [Aphanomyces astaci]|uniref:Uncharacterized protein n=1 Tax=Aphanomyces astaci TaxID=112090 RepID=W4FQT2_APHAT|nr:hypothetical protein H257_15114 [Aphanomyces astaci]ETV69159.1 hypothetical protein H257_15114 [Aphanomyces astaci]|eukprot:XP_009841412.1 hypothetical protein H257_15114 [Aphanomyces astaci]